MNNNLISEATELIKKAILVNNPKLFTTAMNKISMSISDAITPMDRLNMPFIAAILSRYVNVIIDSFDPEQLALYSGAIATLKNSGGEYAVVIPVPIKGDKPNG